MSSLVFELLVILLLVLLNGFFAASELAIVSSRPGRLRQLADDGSRGAGAALALAQDPGRFLSAVQIGITLIGVLAGAFSGATLAGKLAEWLAGFPAVAGVANTLAIAVVVMGITYLSLIVGELVPKRLALHNAERVAARVAMPMTALSRLAAPLVWLLRVSSEGLLRLLGVPTERQVTVTDEEVKALVAEGAEAGIFQQSERDMIDGVLRLDDRPVGSIMTPRMDVIWLDLEADAGENQRRIAESERSRFPVGRGVIDAVEGIINLKDVADRLMRGEAFDLHACMREPLFVPEGTRVLKMLERFRASGTHIAIVVDEYGSFEGIVTPTDILGAIAGEFPEEAEPAEEVAVRREDGSWLVDGRADIQQVERLLERRGMQGDGDFHTLAGFVLRELGHLPGVGELFDWRDLRFEVVDMDGRRIDRVLVSPLPEADGAEPGKP